MTDTTRWRREAYGFLSSAWISEPGKGLLKELANPIFQEAGLDLGLPDDPSQLELEQLEEGLAVEYTGLFLGPGKHIPPHASYWLDRIGGGGVDVQYRVRAFIRSIGLNFASSCKDMPDHIGVLLDCMGRIVEAEAKVGERDREEGGEFRDLERTFLLQFLLNWLPVFCREVSERAELPFYKGLAGWTLDFLNSDKEELDVGSDDPPSEAEGRDREI